MPRKPSVILPDGTRAKKYSLAGINYNHELNGPVHPEPPMFSLFTGSAGMCKTLSAVSYAANCHANGHRVVATDNVELQFGEVFDYRKFLNNEYKGAVILIDELEEYADALRYQSDDALDFVGVLIQLRHEQNEVIATTQFPGEVLSRLRRRINFEVQCFDPGFGNVNTAGRHIYQRWKANPFNDLAATTMTKRVVHDAHEFWPLYNTHAHIRVGGIRKAAKERVAATELAEREAVWGAMWSAVLSKNHPFTIDGTEHPTVSAGEIQVALSKSASPLIISVKKAGRYLGELSAINYRETANNRRWAIPRELFDLPPEPAGDDTENTEAAD